MPKITVLTTFFNSKNTIKQAIESILNQSFTEFEYLLVDDGSTDESADIVNSFEDERIDLIDSGRIGRAAALNLGLEKAQGEYVAILDADDEAYTNRLVIQKEILDKSQISLIASNASIYDDCDNLLGQTNFPSDHNSIVQNLFRMNTFPHSSVMFRRKEVMKFSGYNERCLKSIDFNMYLDLLQENGSFFCVKENLIKLRVYSTSWGVSDSKSLQFYYAYLGLISFYINKKTNKRLLRDDINDFRIIKNLFKSWFYNSDVYKSSMAKKFFSLFLEKFRKREFNRTLPPLVKAFKKDALFWTYRGIKFNYEEDVISFLEYAKSESPFISKIFDNEK